MVRGLITGPARTQAGQVVNFNYAPTISTASQYEAQQALKPMIEQVLRQGNGR